MFEGSAFGGSSQDGSRGAVGQLGGQFWCGASVRFPHADVYEDVRIEVDHRADDPIVFVGVNSMEGRTLESAARRIGIDPGQRSHPRFVLEQTRDLGAELAADTTHKHPLTRHGLPR